jgi:hypothetical protein
MMRKERGVRLGRVPAALVKQRDGELFVEKSVDVARSTAISNDRTSSSRQEKSRRLDQTA